MNSPKMKSQNYKTIFIQLSYRFVRNLVKCNSAGLYVSEPAGISHVDSYWW